MRACTSMIVNAVTFEDYPAKRLELPSRRTPTCGAGGHDRCSEPASHTSMERSYIRLRDRHQQFSCRISRHQPLAIYHREKGPAAHVPFRQLGSFIGDRFRPPDGGGNTENIALTCCPSSSADGPIIGGSRYAVWNRFIGFRDQVRRRELPVSVTAPVSLPADKMDRGRQCRHASTIGLERPTRLGQQRRRRHWSRPKAFTTTLLALRRRRGAL